MTEQTIKVRTHMEITGIQRFKAMEAKCGWLPMAVRSAMQARIINHVVGIVKQAIIIILRKTTLGGKEKVKENDCKIHLYFNV